MTAAKHVKNEPSLSLADFRLAHGFMRPYDPTILLRKAGVFDHQGRLLGVCDLVWGDIMAIKHNLDSGQGIIIVPSDGLAKLFSSEQLEDLGTDVRVRIPALLHLADRLVLPGRVVKLARTEFSDMRIGCQRTVSSGVSIAEREIMTAGEALYSLHRLLRTRD
jgi:hypothetical protein